MYDDFKRILEEMAKLDDAQRAAMQTWFVVRCVITVVYTVVGGIVVWALGRRLIQASFAALREARRSTGGEQ